MSEASQTSDSKPVATPQETPLATTPTPADIAAKQPVKAEEAESKIDWKKTSRKWEERSKANAEAAKQLDTLKSQLAELMEQDKVKSLELLKNRVSQTTGVPAALLSGDTEEAMTASAKALLEWQEASKPGKQFLTGEALGDKGAEVGADNDQLSKDDLSKLDDSEIMEAYRAGRLTQAMGQPNTQ